MDGGREQMKGSHYYLRSAHDGGAMIRTTYDIL